MPLCILLNRYLGVLICCRETNLYIRIERLYFHQQLSLQQLLQNLTSNASNILESHSIVRIYVYLVEANKRTGILRMCNTDAASSLRTTTSTVPFEVRLAKGVGRLIETAENGLQLLFWKETGWG